MAMPAGRTSRECGIERKGQGLGVLTLDLDRVVERIVVSSVASVTSVPSATLAYTARRRKNAGQAVVGRGQPEILGEIRPALAARCAGSSDGCSGFMRNIVAVVLDAGALCALVERLCSRRSGSAGPSDRASARREES